MYVEQLNLRQRTKLGSMTATIQSRLAAGGDVTAVPSFIDRPANHNEIPTVPMNTGLLGATRVNTPQGPVAVEDLHVGQQILTSRGVETRLMHVLPAKRPSHALRIRAPYFGTNQDLVIATDHLLEIRSDIVEYMFGAQCVLVPAWAFKDNAKVVFHELTKTDAMYQLQTDATDGLAIGDCHVAPLLTGAAPDGKRVLTDVEARAFATERRIGQYN